MVTLEEQAHSLYTDKSFYSPYCTDPYLPDNISTAESSLSDHTEDTSQKQSDDFISPIEIKKPNPAQVTRFPEGCPGHEIKSERLMGNRAFEREPSVSLGDSKVKSRGKGANGRSCGSIGGLAGSVLGRERFGSGGSGGSGGSRGRLSVIIELVAAENIEVGVELFG